jgi:transposase
MIGVHFEEIVAYWTRWLTAAFIEGLNSLFPAMKRMDRGHRTVGSMTAMLYFAPEKFTLP